MTAATDNAMTSAWTDWADALVATLFPVGLGPGQHFAFGQTTLVVDFANSDPQVVNAEIFRIGDTVPQASRDFAPSGSLSQAYGYFLQSLPAPAPAQALAAWNDAVGTAPGRYNMPTRMGAQVQPGALAGALPGGSGGSGGDPAAPTLYVPAYTLDAGFRAKYVEWQASSVAGRTRDGGVIRVRSSSAASAAAAPLTRSLRAAAAPVDTLPPFLRLQAPAPARPLLRGAAVPGSISILARTGAAPGSGQGPATGMDDYAIDVSFTGLGTFMLGPTPWFSDTVVRLFVNRLSAQDRASYFGNAGVLTRRVFQVVVGFEPSASLRFDTQGSSQAGALLATPRGSSIGVGPLSFDTGSMTSVPGQEGTTVTIGAAASRLPVLLGVVSTDLLQP